MLLPGLAPVPSGPDFAVAGGQFAVLGIAEFKGNNVSGQRLSVGHGAEFGKEIEGFTVDGSAGLERIPGVAEAQDRRQAARALADLAAHRDAAQDQRVQTDLPARRGRARVSGQVDQPTHSNSLSRSGSRGGR